VYHHPVIPSKKQVKKATQDPSKAASYFLKPRYRNTCVRITSRLPVGTNILAHDWDVCIILDTCRVDALRAVADEYAFVGEVKRIWSLGGSSPEWMVQTFDSDWIDILSDTAYLTANAWTERVLADRLCSDHESYSRTIIERLRKYGNWDPVFPFDLGRLEKIWEYVPEDQEMNKQFDPGGLMPGGAPARYVTDRAISVAQNNDYDRLILHYMQPHAPYLANAWTTQRDPHEYEKRPFEYLRKSGDRKIIWNTYINELRYVLDDVALLLRNIEANQVVISADHGEAFGEFGVFNHHTGSLHPQIRFVPWVETSATESDSYTPQVKTVKKNNISVNERLEALGYKS